MATGSEFRDELIEIGARALARGRGYDPDFILASPDKAVQEYAYIDGKPVPTWEHYRQDAARVIDAIFDRNKEAA